MILTKSEKEKFLKTLLNSQKTSSHEVPTAQRKVIKQDYSGLKLEVKSESVLVNCEEKDLTSQMFDNVSQKAISLH